MTEPTGSPLPDFAGYLAWRSVLEDPAMELDLSHSALAEEHLQTHRPALQKALQAMAALEAGAIANADENRMVGHYWLRAPGLAPDAAIGEQITTTLAAVEDLAARVLSGAVAPPEGGTFTKLVVAGIGGSALGPMLLADALGERHDNSGLQAQFLDNTDPDGIDRAVARLGTLQDTLIVVISKSGGTKETRNCMLELQQACAGQGLDFAARAVAVSGDGSKLWQLAKEQGWLATLPMWDWVGGRTSLWLAVGLLPAALMGLDTRGLLAGAAAMDAATRNEDLQRNPAAMLALFWLVQGNGRGERAMVVLPYKDRLVLFSRYLQQLVMESLGKHLDRQGQVVDQGIAVYGNKGSTDQHAFVQQLRDGRHDFFAVFVRVLQDAATGDRFEVEPGATTGDYLDGFWQGTRQALWQRDRASATLTLAELGERSMGALLALFERAVGLYAELIDINAYHQPGVEAGKVAAGEVLDRQQKLLQALDGESRTCEQLATAIGAPPLQVWPILQHLTANRAEVHGEGLHDPQTARFRRV